MSANVESMVYAGETPWHGLGVRVDKEITAAEAIQKSGLDWKVELRPIQTVDGVAAPEHCAVVRVRPGKKPNVLGVVSKKYKLIQNSEAFDFFDHVVGHKQAVYHTAGALGAGERVWILAKLPGSLAPVKDDEIHKYLLLTTGHTGIIAQRMLWTPIRVVCQNTLNIALSGLRAGEGIRIRHAGNIEAKIEEAQRALGLSIKYYNDLEDSFKLLAGHQMKKDQVARLFDTIFPLREDRKDDTSKGNAGVRERILHLNEKGAGSDIKGVRGTAWGYYNSIVEFVDHFRKTRGKNVQAKAESRLTSQWFGTGARLKQQAFKTLTEIAK